MISQQTERAREILARLEEIDGNKAGAFTLRTEGAVGSVFEAKLAVVQEALTPQTSEEVVKAVARAKGWIEDAYLEGYSRGMTSGTLVNREEDWLASKASAAIAAMPPIPQESVAEVTEELRWHVARALSIPQHHTTWDTLSEQEKDLFYMQADYAIAAMTSARDREQPK